MKKLSLILFALFTATAYSQDAALDSIALTEVTVTSKVVDVAKERETPIAFSTVTGAEIELKGGNLEFVETLCAIGCLSILKLFKPDKLKVASRDLTNLPLLSALAETKIPIILSTGMAGDKELQDALKVITPYHSDITILHCVSQYPTEPKNVNLNTIPYLIEKYNKYKIGYSDHTIGISTPVAAVALGAEIIEKHITLDRNMKGTDQAGSLGPDGVRRMVRDIRILDNSKGIKEMFIVPDTASAKMKLERSIATKNILSKGHVITEKDIHLLSPGDGFKWVDKDKVIGKELLSEIFASLICIYEKILRIIK